MLKRWADEHPHARPLSVAYFGFVDPALAGLDTTLPPKLPPGATPPPGWYAISVNSLHSYPPDGASPPTTDEPAFVYFNDLTPVDRVGYSIYVYHVGE